MITFIIYSMNKLIVFLYILTLSILIINPTIITPTGEEIKVRIINSPMNEVISTYYLIRGITSCEVITKEGTIALSPDLYNIYDCGDSVYYYCRGCPLEGVYVVADKTSNKYRNRIDVFFNNKSNKDLGRGYWSGVIFKI